MLSTIFLRETAMHPVKSLLYGHYEFDSVDRVKIRYGHKFYVVKWKKTAPRVSSVAHTPCTEEFDMQQDVIHIDESVNLLDELDVPMIRIDGGCHVLLTDENMELVQSAFPEEVNRFLQEKV